MYDAADNSMLPEHIIIFPQTDCKSECIFHLLKSAAKVAFFNGKKEENPRKFEGKFKENAHNEGQCVAFWKNALAFELKCKYVLIKT